MGMCAWRVGPAWWRWGSARTARTGFTLIELLIVLVILGILATIAIPKFANTKEKSYLATMKSDLRNLVTAQEAYVTIWTTYSNDITQLVVESPGVSITLQDVSGTGWGGKAKHGGTAHTCAVFYGLSQPPVAPATIEGIIACN